MVWYIPIILSSRPILPYHLNSSHTPPTQPGSVFASVFDSINTTLAVCINTFPRRPLISSQYHHVTPVDSFRLGLAKEMNLGIDVNFGKTRG